MVAPVNSGADDPNDFEWYVLIVLVLQKLDWYFPDLPSERVAGCVERVVEAIDRAERPRDADIRVAVRCLPSRLEMARLFAAAPPAAAAEALQLFSEEAIQIATMFGRPVDPAWLSKRGGHHAAATTRRPCAAWRDALPELTD